MFQVTIDDINKILKDFGFMEQAASFDELQRYHYEKKRSRVQRGAFNYKGEI